MYLCNLCTLCALVPPVPQCGMAVFPNNVFLLVVYANFVLEARKDGPAARTQLQLALKAGPSTLQRYQIFSTIENSKRLKDGQEGQLDLQSYVEFKRNYRWGPTLGAARAPRMTPAASHCPTAHTFTPPPPGPSSACTSLRWLPSATSGSSCSAAACACRR